MEGYHVYISLSLLLVLGCRTRGENCHVNPECICSRQNGSTVSCNLTCGPNSSKFSASSVQFDEVRISGTRDIKYIQDNSFQGLITKKLIIEKTGISDISCNASSGLEDTLTSLFLESNYLASIPTCSLQRLSNLQYLSLLDNNVMTVSSEGFRGLSNLQNLRIDRNKLATIEANAFNGLTKLKVLNLSDNQITYLDGSAFRGLQSLTELNLGLNKLSYLHPRIFSELKQLRHLDLSNNNISSLDSTLFQGLTNLRYLFMRNNRICSLPESIFLDNTGLSTLYLHSNCLNSLHDNLFQTNSQLGVLNLDWNFITNISPGVFQNLSNLVLINLQGNKLTEIFENIFGGSPNIRFIHLNNNSIHTVHDGAFRNLRNLHTLDLSENNLKRIDSSLCVNCSQLHDLSLSQNHIDFIHEMSLNNLPRLYQLKLDRNNLSPSSWTWLLKVITQLRTLGHLYLSHNPIQTLPSKLFSSIKPFLVILRNCSLDSFPDSLTNYSARAYGLDISSNNLQSFGTAANPRYVLFRFIDASNNYLKSFNVLSREGNLDYILLGNNSVQIPIFISGFQTSMNIDYVDLSYNYIQSVNGFPITMSGDTQPVNPCDESHHFSVKTLNLSRNGISLISPEACLGMVETLDLSYNQLSVFGELMPSHNSSTIRLRHLYVSGNNIHQVSTDALVGLDQLYTLDFRFNNIGSLQFAERHLMESSLRNLSVSGNPLSCDCSSVWLRNGSIPNKMDLARCQSPASAIGYLVYCYPVTDCPVQPEISITENTREICDQDSALNLSYFIVTPHDSIVKTFWIKTGPGRLSGYKLELRELNSGRVDKTLFIHPEMTNLTVSDLELQQIYNICLSAQLHGKRVSNEICKEVTISGVELFCADADVVIGVSVSLALFLITAISLLIYVLYKRKVFHHTESSPEFGRQQINETERPRENTNMYQHRMNSTGVQSNTEELYEDLDLEDYESPVVEK